MSDLGTSLTPLSGGHSGRTFLGDVGGERAVVRVYPPGDPRGATAPEVDAAVLRLVRGLLPVPEVVEVRREQPHDLQPGLLVTEWLPGERADLVVADLEAAGDADGLSRLGAETGRVAGMLAGMPMLRPGPFVDSTLTLGEFPDGGLLECVEHRLTGWSEGERARLGEVAAQAQDLLDTVDRASLVHSDLNPKNLLVDRDTSSVTAVLDWEFAHAGHPWTDVGNLLRFERHPAYVDAVLSAWTSLRGGTPEQLLEGARSADLWALVDLAARAGANPVADRAETLLRAIGESGDVHAWPFG
ncbi:aminoglycoside phosphotransferase (APT) family kinase protein [Nocardioides sp. BE266]|uniref:phosphotransferase n=1 Tax=Nocardioides sp. BE266 TaxID=2817725 RepID=UPI0028559BDC|nr:phosphotransferase [Nocardioides sp. BE266]MDR7254553.1 aminoglycoside phosphotransferase (APT) family kinase protein [Nocardioides sp. BE266]